MKSGSTIERVRQRNNEKRKRNEQVESEFATKQENFEKATNRAI